MNDIQQPTPSSPVTTRQSIRTKLAGFVALVVLLTAMLAGWTGYEFARRTLREQIHQRLAVVAADREKMMENYVAQQKERVSLVASRTQLRELLAVIAADFGGAISQRQQAAKILTHARDGTQGFIDIWVCDDEGRVLATTNEGLAGETFAEVPAFVHGQEAAFLAAPFEQSGRFVARLAAPAIAEGGERLGVVIVLIDVQPLVDLLVDPTGLGASGEILVARQTGEKLQYLLPPRHSPNEPVSPGDAEVLALAVAGESGERETVCRGKEVFADFRPANFQPRDIQAWGMVTKIDTDEAYAPVAALRGSLLLLNTVLLLAGVAAAIWIAQRFTRPLLNLSQQAESIAAGDLTAHADVQSDDEMGKLAGALNNMADRLRQAQEEMEERVELRTQALALAQQEVRRQAKRTRGILATTSDAFVAMDQDGLIIDWNAAAEKVFGWSAEEASGRGVAELLVPQSLRQQHRDGLENFLATGEGPLLGQLIEVTALHRDGHELPIELTISPLQDDDGSWTFNAFIHDITERKQAELDLQLAKEAAEEANQAKSDFLANMSHEIRTPMNAIVGMTELTLDTKLDDRQRGNLQTVLESAEHLLTIINEILDFSKIEAGKMELEVAPFSLRESLGDTLKVLAVRAHRKNLELAYHVAPDVPDGLLGDVGRIRQIIINLVGNAIKFTEVGEVLVDVDSSPRGQGQIDLKIAVKDTGIGIPADRVSRIFDSFEQADTSTTRQYGGTGLGLAICRQLVDLMGGTIDVHSTQGQGSTFRVTIPVQWSPDAAVTQPAQEPDIAALRVLIVDDNQTNRSILEEITRVWRMDPVGVASGEDALAALEEAAGQRQPFRLVLTDLHMPAMDGLAFVSRMRKLAIAHQPVVIMLTSGERPTDARRRAELDIPVCLLKPIKQSELLESILSLLGSRRVVRATTPDDPQPAAMMRPLHVLVAEDGESNRKLLAALLAKWGHSCVMATNGAEAVEQNASDDFDLILMDIEMPQMDGWQATGEIRRREQATGRHTPIIALTAHALAGDEQRCLDAGMDGYVSKPIRSALLCETMAAVVAQPLVESDTPENASNTSTSQNSTETPVQQKPKQDGDVDLNAALEALGGDKDLLEIVARAFLDESPRLLEDLRQAVDAGDAKRLQSAAHALKGTVRYYGQTRAYELSYRLETQGAAGTLDGAKDVLPCLAAEIDALRQRLAILVASGSDSGAGS